MNRTFFLLIFITYPFFAGASNNWKLVWSDEFDYSGLPEKSKWGYDVGCSGWGNQELENYTKEDLDNAKVENGTLVITARKEKAGQCDYTSSRLVTKNKGDWLYGRFEIAAKLPKGKGLWPAIWMLPTDNSYGIWPKSGEIDIMENVGFDPFNVHFTIHTEAYNHSIGTSKGATIKIEDPHSKFIVYALEWFKDRVDFFVNDNKVFTFKNEGAGSNVWPFDKRFHLLLNIAVGGSWGGQQGVDDMIFPQSLIIDYVRVYAYDSTGVLADHRSPVKNRRPEIRREKNKLIFRTDETGNVMVGFFSMNGKHIFECAYQCKKSNEYSVILPQGASIAVIKNGTTRRSIPLVAVD